MSGTGVIRLCAMIGAVLASPLAVVAARADAPATLPRVLPQPVSMALTGDTLDIGASARLIVTGDVDAETLRLVRQSLATIGITHLRPSRRYSIGSKETQVVLGLAGNRQVDRALLAAGGTMTDKAQGYAIASAQGPGTIGLIVLDGQDADGLYYAAQTFSQIATRGTLPALSVTDYPRMAVRGTLEGFSGAPWSFEDRRAHLAFLGSLKANTYVYGPKDDPYARAKWRDPYPVNELSDLRWLATTAREYHVRFTYEISPGLSICYSSARDIAALEDKFEAFRREGVRSFSIGFDEASFAKWNCDADAKAFGDPGAAAAGAAQVQLANTIHTWLKQRFGREAELMIVPTEDHGTQKSAYRTALQALDPDVLIQWGGSAEVSAFIGVRDAKAAQEAFGRTTLLRDNYPANDYQEASGRLLMGAYRNRETGLDASLTGVLANAMNQEAASRIALAGSAAFGWNDRVTDPEASSLFVARQLAGRDGDTTDALLLLFDLENLAPTSGGQPWQPQAPVTSRELDWVRDALANSSTDARKSAVERLSDLAERIAKAPARIRKGVEDRRFLEEAAPWLDAMALWGQALQATSEGLSAALKKNSDAVVHFAEAKSLAGDAGAVQTIAGTSPEQGAIRLGDGVLDRFIADAPGLVYVPPRKPVTMPAH